MRLLVVFFSLHIGNFFIGAVQATSIQPTPAAESVTVEIHYNSPEAGVVDLVWGIDGWQRVPEELGNEVGITENGLMFTPMHREAEVFSAEIHVPAGSIVDYGFSVKETADGRIVDVWDKGKDPQSASASIQPVLIATYDKVFIVNAAINPNTPFITQTFLYSQPEASEVILVWGIDGWKIVPEAASAADTTISEDLMNTRMIRRGDNFQVSILVPQDSIIQYGFSFKGHEDTVDPEKAWTWIGEYSLHAHDDGAVVFVDSHTVPTPPGQPANQPSGEQSSFMSLLTKHWPLLIVGFCIALGLLIAFRKY